MGFSGLVNFWWGHRFWVGFLVPDLISIILNKKMSRKYKEHWFGKSHVSSVQVESIQVWLKYGFLQFWVGYASVLLHLLINYFS